MAKNKETGADETPENSSAQLPPGGSPPAPDNAAQRAGRRDESIPGGRFMVDGRLVNAEGRPIAEDGKPLADPNPAETPRETA